MWKYYFIEENITILDLQESKNLRQVTDKLYKVIYLLTMKNSKPLFFWYNYNLECQTFGLSQHLFYKYMILITFIVNNK